MGFQTRRAGKNHQNVFFTVILQVYARVLIDGGIEVLPCLSVYMCISCGKTFSLVLGLRSSSKMVKYQGHVFFGGEGALAFHQHIFFVFNIKILSKSVNRF